MVTQLSKTLTPFDYFYADKVSVAGILCSTNWEGLCRQAGIVLYDTIDKTGHLNISDSKFEILMEYLWT